MPVTTECEGFPRTADNSPRPALFAGRGRPDGLACSMPSAVIEAQRALRGDRYGRVQPLLVPVDFSAHSEPGTALRDDVGEASSRGVSDVGDFLEVMGHLRPDSSAK